MQAGARRPRRSHGFLAEGAQALATLLFFVGLALAGSDGEGGASPPPSRYASGVDDASGPPPARIWLIDGFNVLHTAVLRGERRESWWKQEGRALLIARMRAFREPAQELWLVFDGPHPADEPQEVQDAPDRLRIVFAPSADDWLIARVRLAAHPEEIAVVSADRRVAARARRHGARVVAPRRFVERCGDARPAFRSAPSARPASDS